MYVFFNWERTSGKVCNTQPQTLSDDVGKTGVLSNCGSVQRFLEIGGNLRPYEDPLVAHLMAKQIQNVCNTVKG